MGIVQCAAADSGAVAEKEITAGFLLQHVGKVFGTHAGRGIAADVFSTDDSAGGTGGNFSGFRVIDGGRITWEEGELTAAVVGSADTAGGFFNSTHKLIAYFFLKTAQ